MVQKCECVVREGKELCKMIERSSQINIVPQTNFLYKEFNKITSELTLFGVLAYVSAFR